MQNAPAPFVGRSAASIQRPSNARSTISRASGEKAPYAFGLLLSFSIYRRWVDEGDALVEPILDFLRAGATKPPAELVRGVGFDLDDPAFWQHGLDAVEALVVEAEDLAARMPAE